MKRLIIALTLGTVLLTGCSPNPSETETNSEEQILPATNWEEIHEEDADFLRVDGTGGVVKRYIRHNVTGCVKEVTSYESERYEAANIYTENYFRVNNADLCTKTVEEAVEVIKGTR